MKHFTTSLPGVVSGLLLAAVLVAPSGCRAEPPAETKKPPEAKKVPVGKNVSLVIQDGKRSVHIDSIVCLREGPLEQLLTIRYKKEHEAILAAEIDGRDLHKALLLAGAEVGSPVQYNPKFKSPTGTKIKVYLEWEEKGKMRRELAQKWVQNFESKKELEGDWVFAGSRFVKNLDPAKPDYYLANDGDVICVANFESALLDLPFNSSKVDVERAFVAFTDRIPPKDTKVTVILEPVVEKKKDDKGKEKK